MEESSCVVSLDEDKIFDPKTLVPGALTREAIKKWDRGVEGDLTIGSEYKTDFSIFDHDGKGVLQIPQQL
jgi:hypothetical protein